MASIQKNFLYNTLLAITQVLFPLITFPYIARIIQPVGVGTVSFAESICRYAILISALGIPIYGVREVAKCKDDKVKVSNLCSELLLIHFVTTLITIVIYVFMVFNFDKFYHNVHYYILGIAMILSNVFVMEWYFQGIGDFKFITIRTLFVRTITIIAVFFLVKKPDDGIYFFLLIVITNVLNGIINFWYAKRNLLLSLKINFHSLKKHFNPLFLIFSTTLSISVYVLLDTIMLGFLSDEKSVGFYSMALRISKIPMLFVGALGIVLIPQLSLSYSQNNHKDFNRLITKSINFVITFSFPVIFLFLGISEELIIVFAGDEFSGGSITLKILSVVVLLIGLSNVFGLQILTPMGKDKYLTYSVILGTFISVILNLILIPIYHDRGAAISNIVTESAVTLATFYFASKFIKLKLDYLFIVQSFFFCVPIYFVPNCFRYISVNNLVILIGTSITTGVYFLCVQLYIIKNQIIIDLINQYKQKLWPITTI